MEPRIEAPRRIIRKAISTDVPRMNDNMHMKRKGDNF
jgi:hypothetical protein